MNLEALYQEIEVFKAGGTLSSKELTDLYTQRETYKKRKTLRRISGVIYFLLLVLITLSLFYSPVRSFMTSYLKLGDNFWKTRGALFLATVIANCFLSYWRTGIFWIAIAGTIVLSIFSLGIFFWPYLALLGLFISFLMAFSIYDIDNDIKKAESMRKKEIYNIAIEENDMNLMQSLAEIQCKEAETYILKKKEEEEERKQKEAEQREEERRQQEEVKKQQEKLIEDQLEGQKMYEEAIASDPVNEELMKQAAKLGSVSACYYLGKNLLSEWLSDMYTTEEKERLAEDASKYFDVARQIATLAKLDIKTECYFLWLFSRLQYESNTKSQWQEMLSGFREIQKSSELPEEYKETLEIAIKSVINNINRLIEQSNTQPNYDTEPTKKLYCKFRNGAICTKLSNSVLIYHCDYVNAPGKCLTAHDSHSLEWR